ncbi:MAG: hypothetical protein KAU24_00210 [Candidatus Aenigmarchaeota archaeon]|nr:hypothetical protein [Candidatus Aenigmarchaeota archaeon]
MNNSEGGKEENDNIRISIVVPREIANNIKGLSREQNRSVNQQIVWILKQFFGGGIE